MTTASLCGYVKIPCISRLPRSNHVLVWSQVHYLLSFMYFVTGQNFCKAAFLIATCNRALSKNEIDLIFCL